MDLLKQINLKIKEFPNKDDAAKFFGIAPGTLGKFLSGNANLSIAAIQKLIDYLVDAGRLRFDQPAAQPPPPVVQQQAEPDSQEQERPEIPAPTNLNQALSIVIAEVGSIPGDDLRFLIDKASNAVRAKITLCVPTARGVHITGPNLMALAGSSKNFRCNRLVVEKGVNIEDAMNMMAARVLEDKSVEWAMFIHPEIFVPFGNEAWFRRVTKSPFSKEFLGMNAIERMCSNRDNHIVGGVYTCLGDPKRLAIQPDVEPSDDADKAVSTLVREKGPQNKLLAVPWVSSWLMAVHRSAFEKILATTPEEQLPKNGQKFPFFAPSLDEFGGDRRFGQLAKRAGLNIKLDLAIHGVGWTPKAVIAKTGVEERS